MRRTQMTLAAIVMIAVTGCGSPQDAGASGAEGGAETIATATTAPPSAAADPSTAASSAPSPAPSASSQPPAEPLEFAEGIEPERVRIPAIDVDAEVIELGQLPDGSLEVPQDYADTGWWDGGPKPGGLGAAVIAGHVDSKTGPAVFYDLRDLAPGDSIEVVDADGEQVAFTVDRLEQHPKNEFPTKAVYAYTREPSLRLVTCGGDFDRSSGHYVDNIVVFASLDS